MAANDSLTFVIKADTSEARAAVASLTATLAKLVGAGRVQVGDPTKTLTGGLKGAADAAKGAAAGIDQARAAASRQMQNPATKTTAGLKEADKAGLSFIATMRRGAAAVATLAAAGAVKQQFGALTRAIGDYESDMARLAHVHDGDAKKAADDMQWLREQADRLGLPLDDLAERYSKLGAALKGSEAAPYLRDIFLGAAEASAALKLTGEDVKLVMYALEQMGGKGIISMEELRRQMGERLPIALRAFANAAGLSIQDFVKLVEKGAVKSADLLPAAAAELRKMVEGSLDEASRSFVASINRMNNALLKLRQDAGKGALGAELKKSIDEMTATFNSGGFNDGVQLFAIGLAKAVNWIASFVKGIPSLGKVLAAMFHQVWNELDSGFRFRVAQLKSIYNGFLAWAKTKIAETLESDADTFAKLPLVGDWIAGKYRETAASMRKSAASDERAAKLADVAASKAEAEYWQRRAEIDDALKALLTETNVTTPKPPINDPGKPQNLGGAGDDKDKDKTDAALRRQAAAMRDFRKAEMDADKTAFEARQEVFRAALDSQVQMQLVSKREEIAKRLELDLAGVAKEREIREKALADMRADLANVKDPSEKIRVGADVKRAKAELDALKDKEVVLHIRAEIENDDLSRQIEDLRRDLQFDIADLLTPDASALDRIREETRKMLEDPRVRGDAALESLVRRRGAMREEAQAFTNAKSQFDQMTADLQRAEARIQAQYDAGTLTALEREEALNAARTKQLGPLRAQLEVLREIAKKSGNKDQLIAVEDAIDGIDAVSARLNSGMTGALANARGAFGDMLREWMSGAATFSDALRSMLANALQKVSDRFLNEFLEGMTKGLAQQSGGGGIGGMLAGAAKFLFGSFDSGGWTGPGARLQPAGIVHRDEWVVPKRVVQAMRSAGQMWQLAYLNRYGRVPRNLPGYANGGLVSAGAGVSLAGGPTTVQNAINVSPRVEVTTGQIVDGLRRDSNASRWVLSVINENRRSLGLSG